MSMIFRDAAPGDAAALSALGRQTFTETFGHLYSPENLAAFLLNHAEERWAEDLRDPEMSVRVLEADGQLAAYAKVGPPTLPFEPQGPSAELRQFYVLKPWHGRGISDALMCWAIEEARRRRAEDLYLSVFVDNHRARRFYERHGFEFVGIYAFMVGSHADEDHVMRLRLGD
jgi:ribosomal protein S18 acetylase RimI-like enzyme